MMLWCKGLRGRIGSCWTRRRWSGSWCRRAACSRFWPSTASELFPDSFIADLFSSSTGRPSLPADLIGSVLVLKELYDLSDPQTAEALSYDIRWKVACGRSLTQTSFDPSTLVYWRRRIAELGAPGPGVRRGGGGDRRDRDAAWPSETVRGFDGVRRRGGHPGHGHPAGGGDAEGGAAGARRAIGDRAGRQAATTPSRASRDIDWDDPQAKQELVSDLVNDALAVLAELTRQDAPAARGRPRRTRWGCWRWSPARTWNRPRAPMAPTGGGASRGGWRRIG